ALPPPTADAPAITCACQPGRRPIAAANASARTRISSAVIVSIRCTGTVDAQRAHQRVSAYAVHERGAAEDDAGLRSAKDLVAAEAAEIDARSNRVANGRFL